MVRTEGAPATWAARRGFTFRLTEIAPGCQHTDQCIHREQVAVNNIPPDLDSVLKEIMTESIVDPEYTCFLHAVKRNRQQV